MEKTTTQICLNILRSQLLLKQTIKRTNEQIKNIVDEQIFTQINGDDDDQMMIKCETRAKQTNRQTILILCRVSF